MDQLEAKDWKDRRQRTSITAKMHEEEQSTTFVPFELEE
jgi:hypothetical protein